MSSVEESVEVAVIVRGQEFEAPIAADEETDEDIDEETDEVENAFDDNEDAPSKAEGVSHFFKLSAKGQPFNHERGEAVKKQLALFDGLLEARIKIQKSLSVCNTIPHPNNITLFTERLDESDVDEAGKVQLQLRELLGELVGLQNQLLKSNPVVSELMTRKDDDEEIESDPEDDDAKDFEGDGNLDTTRAFTDTSMGLKEMEKLLDENYLTMEAFRNATLETWNSRTQQFMVGAKKGFSSFEQAPVAQIHHIMSNKQRLIQRTQTPRSAYRIRGTNAGSSANEAADADQKDDLAEPKLNPEIFDDDDFYHTLLRELIERKSGDVSDPLELSRQQIQLAQLRKRTKKVIDSKATRDRKLKFDAHPKLIGFMASQRVCSITEQARDDIYKSLFGKLQRGTTVDGVDSGLGGLRLVR